MTWQYSPFGIPSMLAIALSLVTGLVAWHRRSSPGAIPLLFLLLSVMLWSLFSIFKLLWPDPRLIYFFMQVEQIGVVGVPAFWFIFALDYAGFENWLTRRNLSILAGLEAVILLVVFSNAWHGWMWASMGLNASGPYPMLTLVRGPWWWVNIGMNYLLILAGTLALVWRLIHSWTLYRQQAGIILVGVLVSWSANSLVVLKVMPLYLNPMPLAFSLSGLCFLWGCSRLRLLAVVPIAREKVVEQLGDGVFVMDQQNQIVDVNPAARQIVRLAPAVIGQPAREVLRAWPELVESVIFQTEAAPTVSAEGRVYAVSVAALTDRHGTAAGRLIVFHDITEQKQAETLVQMQYAQLQAQHDSLTAQSQELHQAYAEIRQLNQELEQRVHERTAQLESANQELEAFAYSVSHDLQAPLRSIGAYGQCLVEDCAAQLDETGQHYLSRIQAATLRMNELIEALLHLSRVIQSPLDCAPVDLSALAQAVMAELQQREPARQADWCVAPALSAQADGRLLRVVLENLLGNAWKFTLHRPRARIEFGTGERADGVPAYFVRDNGAGFDMAHVDRLFGAFQRLHTAQEFPGTGIGLATVKRIILRHGGQVWAEGAVEQGATFYFTLPGRG